MCQGPGEACVLPAATQRTSGAAGPRGARAVPALRGGDGKEKNREEGGVGKEAKRLPAYSVCLMGVSGCLPRAPAPPFPRGPPATRQDGSAPTPAPRLPPPGSGSRPTPPPRFGEVSPRGRLGSGARCRAKRSSRGHSPGRRGPRRAATRVGEEGGAGGVRYGEERHLQHPHPQGCLLGLPRGECGAAGGGTVRVPLPISLPASPRK